MSDLVFPIRLEIVGSYAKESKKIFLKHSTRKI